MADIQLVETSPLGGMSMQTDRCTLKERGDIALISAAIPRGAAKDFAQTLKSVLGLDMPTALHSTTHGQARAILMTPEQVLVLTTGTNRRDAAHLRSALGKAAYVTEQTDAWVICEMQGPGVRDALERLCPIDLADENFSINRFARTTMEHMGALILRSQSDEFLLLSASSSAASFAKALEHSLHYTR